MLFGKSKIKTEIIIEGMHCMHCPKKTENALKGISAVKGVKIDLENKKALVTSSEALDEDMIRFVIAGIGFTVVEVKEG